MRAVHIDLNANSAWGLVWLAGDVIGRVHREQDGTRLVYYPGRYNVSEPGPSAGSLPEMQRLIERANGGER